jgi:nucleoside-diphosphate-sugar epimerase
MDAGPMSGVVLVTGAQGFVGRYMACELLRAGWRAVVGVGRSPLSDAFTHNVFQNGATQPARLTVELLRATGDPRYCYRQADITDAHSMAEVIAEFEPEVIIHLASTRREDAVKDLIHGNVQGVRSLVDACRAAGDPVRRIVLGSSGGVYGVPGELPLRESMPCLPADPYGASKLAGEHFGRVLCDCAGIELVIGRIFNVVGPGQDERHVCGRLASQISAIAREEQPPAVSMAGLFATRDYVDVRDVVSALALLAKNGRPGEIYNIASGVETSVKEILDSLISFAGLADRIRIEQRPDAATGIARHFANVEKLDSEGHWRCFDLTASLGEVLRYYLAPAAATAPSSSASDDVL